MQDTPGTGDIICTVLHHEIERRLSEITGSRVHLERYERLNLQDALWVGRCHVRGAHLPPTIIAKHVLPGVYPPRDASDIPFCLQRETLAYHFLMDARDRFDAFPRLLGHGPGLVLLEDLGGEHNKDALPWPALMESLAALHASQRDRNPAYRDLRRRAGLSPDENDDDFLARRLAHFEAGARELKTYAQIFGVETRGFDEGIATVREAFEHPGDLNTFIHSDHASWRQSVERGGRVYLIDFEHARYGHALLDIALAMVGKVETCPELDCHFVNHLGLPAEAVDVYRHALAARGGPRFTDARWDEALASAVLFITLATFSHILVVGRRAPTGHTSAEDLRALLDRASFYLEGRSGLERLQEILSEVASRIFVAPPWLPERRSMKPA